MTANRQNVESRECATRLLARFKDPKKDAPKRIALIQDLLKQDTDMHGSYAQWLANEHFLAGDFASFEAVLKQAYVRQLEHPLKPWYFDYSAATTWLDATRANMEMKPEVKQKVYTAIRDLRLEPAASSAQLVLLETVPVPPGGKL